MGCTSSAPNMAYPSTAEKSIQFEDETSISHSNDVEEIIYRAADNVNVLPSCDTLPEPVHTIRNKSTASFKNEKDNPEVDHAMETIKKANSFRSLHEEEKVPKLEEVVEKVVELHMTEYVNETQNTETVSEEPTKVEKVECLDKDILKESEATEVEKKDPVEEQNAETEEDPEEALSPSQSESSRATRWEALADIAAELPASLTIDPITGQIYALSK